MRIRQANDNKQKKQIELNSAVINTLIENNDHKNFSLTLPQILVWAVDVWGNRRPL